MLARACLQLLLVHGTHHLHEHHQLSTAVFKAIKYDSIRTVGQGSVEHCSNGGACLICRTAPHLCSLLSFLLLSVVRSRAYLDSAILLGQCRRQQCAGERYSRLCLIGRTRSNSSTMREGWMQDTSERMEGWSPEPRACD